MPKRKPSKSRKGKGPSLLSHSLQRLYERFGMGMVAYGDALAQIKEGRAERIKTHSRRVVEYEVELEGESVRVLYDRRRKQLITALPKKGETR